MNKTVKAKHSTFVEIISSMFILLFLYSAINNIFQIQPGVEVLQFVPLFGISPETIIWSSSAMEFLVALLLFFPRTRKAGFIASLVLIAVFTLYIIYLIKFDPRLLCSCGAIILQLTLKQHLLLNVVLMILALIGIRLVKIKVKIEEQETAPIIYT
jgi:hypothetical protein